MTSRRFLDSLVRPPRESGGRFRPLVLVLIVAGVGVTDYATGIYVSVGILYLLPILLATAWYGRRTGAAMVLLTTVLRFAADNLSANPQALPLFAYWNTTASIITFLFVVWLMDALITLHRQLEAKVAARTAELESAMAEQRRLELEVLETATRERNAFGRELHDGLGQHLVATALAAQVLARQLGQAPAAAAAGRIVAYMEEAIARTRRLARGLLLAQIEPTNLAQELDELAAGASAGGVQCRLVHGGTAVGASPMQCAQLFRIAQEAVANALRHAGAKHVNITLASDEQALCLAVEDDGRGFAAGEDDDGVGLRSMRYRAGLVGATLSILSQDGAGTRVVCRLPQPAAATA
jgi:signal transduction histidine kinase